jgi:BirA family biotin operon repressor/biotin-[acetyl-CoA-carboxylase] ligase
VIDPIDVAGRLGTRWLGRELRTVAETGSTNDDVLALARAGAPHGTVLLADAQTRGRGRLGRSWVSPPGANLYLSALLRPDLPAAALPPVTLAAAVAVAEALNEAGARASIKWPNDVLLMGKKCAGILCESVVRGARVDALVVGVGVNLNWSELPSELAAIATSVAGVLGRVVDRSAFAVDLLGRLERWLDAVFADGAAVIAAWKHLSNTLGQRVTIADGAASFTGRARDLDADGALLVERDNGSVVRVRAGEIALGEAR